MIKELVPVNALFIYSWAVEITSTYNLQQFDVNIQCKNLLQRFKNMNVIYFIRICTINELVYLGDNAANTKKHEHYFELCV